MTILRKFNKNFRLKKKKKKINKDDIDDDDTSSRARTRTTTDDKYCFFNGDEKKVVKILEQLPQLFLESESSSSSYPSFLLITWGVKKRRSLTTNINGWQCSQSPPPPPPLLCNCVTTTTTTISSFILPSNPLSFSSGSFSKHHRHPTTCKRKTTNSTNKAKKMKMKSKSKDTLTSGPKLTKLMMGDQKFIRNLELKSSPSFPDHHQQLQRDSNKLHSNSSRSSLDLSSAPGPTVFSYSAPEEEEEEEEEYEGSLTKVAEESRFGSEMKKKSEYPYSQIGDHESLSGEMGHLVMARKKQQQQHDLSPLLLGIPDLNLGPDDEKFFKSFDMNKQPSPPLSSSAPPLQMC